MSEILYCLGNIFEHNISIIVPWVNKNIISHVFSRQISKVHKYILSDNSFKDSFPETLVFLFFHPNFS